MDVQGGIAGDAWADTNSWKWVIEKADASRIVPEDTKRIMEDVSVSLREFLQILIIAERTYHLASIAIKVHITLNDIL